MANNTESVATLWFWTFFFATVVCAVFTYQIYADESLAVKASNGNEQNCTILNTYGIISTCNEFNNCVIVGTVEFIFNTKGKSFTEEFTTENITDIAPGAQLLCWGNPEKHLVIVQVLNYSFAFHLQCVLLGVCGAALIVSLLYILCTSSNK